MDDVLTKFERYILKRICRRLVRQGWYHKRRITEYYKIMREAAQAEFTEDNRPTLNSFLRECHDDAEWKPEAWEKAS